LGHHAGRYYRGGRAKKLEQAAALLFEGDPSAAAISDDGVPPELMDQIRGDLRERDRTVEVWDENWEPFEVFRLTLTQWRVSFGGPTGLDYTAVSAVMGLRSVEDPADCLERVRVMELEYLRRFSEAR